MFVTLFIKVFMVLSVQLLITFITAFGFVSYCRRAYKRGADWVYLEGVNGAKPDLGLDYYKMKGLFYGSIIFYVALFIALLFVRHNLAIAMVVFAMWSIATGLMIGMSLMLVDENLGVLVLGITASIVFVTALIGMYSGIDFSAMGKWLFIGLIILVILNVMRMFGKIKGAKSKLFSFFGVVLFTLYLVYDFNKIATSENDWINAMDISIDIYLDIINLFIELLSLLSDTN